MRHGGGQLNFETDLSAEDLRKFLKASATTPDVLDLEDPKGDRALIATDSIAYVLIPSDRETRVGFGRL